jgi:hypothetical protein
VSLGFYCLFATEWGFIGFTASYEETDHYGNMEAAAGLSLCFEGMNNGTSLNGSLTTTFTLNVTFSWYRIPASVSLQTQ